MINEDAYVTLPQRGNLAIFQPLRFYMKSISASLEYRNLLFWQLQHLWNLILVNFCTLYKLNLTKDLISEPLKLLNFQFLISRKIEWQKNSEISYCDCITKFYIYSAPNFCCSKKKNGKRRDSMVTVPNYPNTNANCRPNEWTFWNISVVCTLQLALITRCHILEK